MVEGDRHVGAVGVLHRRGGRAAVAARVGVAGGVPEEQRRMARSGSNRDGCKPKEALSRHPPTNTA